MGGKAGRAVALLEGAERIVVGAGAGLSAAAGLDTGIGAVRAVAPEWERAYGIRDLYEGSFYPFPSWGARFAYWARAFRWWRYEVPAFPLYRELLSLLEGRDYFVATTNGDGQFERAGSPMERVFRIQGDHGDFACAASCCDEVHDAGPIYDAMIDATVGLEVPEPALPRCPRCGERLVMRQRSAVRTLEIAPYREERGRYERFLEGCEGKRTVFLELGVGMNTPVLIKYPFWRMAAAMPDAALVSVDVAAQRLPDELAGRSACARADIGAFLKGWRAGL